MSGAMFISDDLVFSFEVSPYMCVPVEILVCGNSLWKGSEWYVCASTTWWFLASCCSSGSSEGPTLLMRRSTVWQHLVVISATQLRSTTTNWNRSKPYNFKTYASRTKKKNQYGQWATDTEGEKLIASLNNGHSQKRKHIQNIFHICHRSWWEGDTVLQKQKDNLAPSSRLLITDLHSYKRVGKILFSGKNLGKQISNFGLSS